MSFLRRFFGRGKAAPAHPEVAIDDENHEWAIDFRHVEGAPVSLRYNVTALTSSHRKAFPVRLVFSLPVRNPVQGGFPPTEEMAALGEAEDIIVHEVAQRTCGYHVLTITGGKAKELVFQIPADVDIAAIDEAAQARIPDYRVHCVALMDEEWEALASIVDVNEG